MDIVEAGVKAASVPEDGSKEYGSIEDHDRRLVTTVLRAVFSEMGLTSDLLFTVSDHLQHRSPGLGARIEDIARALGDFEHIASVESE